MNTNTTAEEFVICCNCHEEVSIEQTHKLYEEYYVCNDCFEDHVILCVNCGEPILDADSELVDEGRVCIHCFDEHYVKCINPECDRFTLKGNGLCCACESDNIKIAEDDRYNEY